MSDAAISQAEIDALLAGVDTASAGSGSASSGATFTEPQKKAINSFFSNIRLSIKSNYDSMTGSDIPVDGPEISIMSKDELLKALPDTVVATVADFSGGLSGDHVFIQSTDLAQKIVGLVNNEPGIQLDDMALSVVSETISQHIGVELTEMERGGIHGAANNPPDTTNVDKDMVRLPQQDFAVFKYTLTVDNTAYPMWEVMQRQAAVDIANAFGAGASRQAASQSAAASNMAQAQPMQAAQPAFASVGAQGGGFGMGMNGGGMQMPQMPSSPVMQGMVPNVQPVQFPNLQNSISPQEQSNISLIMDVYMEMTVELGRTKKVIKDILGMGEGTIIELDKLAGEPVDILVNHKPIAKGEVVVIDENFGVRVTEILSPSERLPGV